MIEPVTLTADELTQVIQLVAPSGIEYQAARICRMLAEQHSVQTVTINSGCSVGNISDVVNNAINTRISKLGLYIACMQPPRQILNKFNQPSGQVLWSFYRDTAANDSGQYQEPLQDALTGDSGALHQQAKAMHPFSQIDPVGDFGAFPHVDFSELPHVDFGELPHVDFSELPHVDFGELPHVNFDLNIEAANFDLNIEAVNFDLLDAEVNHHAGR